MNNNLDNIALKKHSGKIFIIIATLFSILRVYIGSKLPIWFYINSKHDDLLMMRYSDLYQHFTQWDILSLTKSISYSLFLSFVNFSGISYRVWLSLIWIIAGILVVYCIYKFITKNKILLMITFLFIIFLPIGFDSDSTMRIYRNGIIAPFTIIALSSLFIFINTLLNNDKINKEMIFWGLISGLTFTFNYYIKEDGITTIPIFILSILAILIFKLFKENKNILKLVKISLICLIPIIIFGGLTLTYQETNDYYFGISEINTRTGGEIGEFWENLLKIEDENKNTEIWVPPSTIEKAWNASPTLQSRPDLLDSWLHTPWAGGDMKQNPLPGDHVAWSLRDSLNEVGMFPNEDAPNEFFKKVNNELNEAFENGSLNKSDKIFITDSLDGKNIEEMKAIKPYFLSGLKTNLFYSDILMNSGPVLGTSQEITNENTTMAENILNDKLVINESYSPSDETAISLVQVNIEIYKLISNIIVLLSGLGFIGLFINQIKNKFKDRKLNTLLGFEILLIGTFFVQLFAIAWFNVFLSGGGIKFYTVGCLGLFAFFEVLSICGGYCLLNKYLKNRKK